MANLKKWILGIGLALVVLIILLIVIPIEEGLEGQLFYGIHLILIITYVVVTYYLVSINEKFVCIQNTPVVTAEVNSHLGALERLRLQHGRELSENEVNDIENTNITKLILHNPSKNNAMDVRIAMTAYVNDRRVNSSPPFDGSRDWHVQAGHTVMRVFKMQEDYLSTADCTIQSMAEETTEANREKQLILKVSISYSDGCEGRIEQPVLSWYFDFKDMRWKFVI